MNVTRYQPWSLLARMQQDADRMFGHYSGIASEPEPTVADWVPAVDIREEEDKFVLHVDVPGVKPDDIELTMEDGVLTIQGSRSNVTQQTKNGYRRIERVAGKFFRRFTLPDTADAKDISANTAEGVLEVVIPKQSKAQPRRITVAAA